MSRIAPWLPETLYGVRAVPGTLYLEYFPAGEDQGIPEMQRRLPSGRIVQEKQIGWLLHAVREPDLPRVKQSMSTVVHFTSFLGGPNKFWFGPSGQLPQGRRMKFFLIWISNSCAPWLLYQCWNAAAPAMQPLRPMVRSTEIETVLQNAIHTYGKEPGTECPLITKILSVKEAEKILGVKWNVGIDRIYAAYASQRERWNFLNFPPEDEANVSERLMEVEKAFARLLAARFMSVKWPKPIESNRNRLQPHQVGNLITTMELILRERAMRFLLQELVDAPKRGEDPPEVTPVFVEILAKELLADIFRARGEHERAEALEREAAQMLRKARGLAELLRFALSLEGVRVWR